jgi:hypothetical protein
VELLLVREVFELVLALLLPDARLRAVFFVVAIVLNRFCLLKNEESDPVAQVYAIG